MRACRALSMALHLMLRLMEAVQRCSSEQRVIMGGQRRRADRGTHPQEVQHVVEVPPVPVQEEAAALRMPSTAHMTASHACMVTMLAGFACMGTLPSTWLCICCRTPPLRMPSKAHMSASHARMVTGPADCACMGTLPRILHCRLLLGNVCRQVRAAGATSSGARVCRPLNMALKRLLGGAWRSVDTVVMNLAPPTFSVTCSEARAATWWGGQSPSAPPPCLL